MVAGILAIPDLMALDTGDRGGRGKVMAQEEQAAPPVFKAGVFPLQPVPVAALG